MAFTPKTPAKGDLPNSVGTLYTMGAAGFVGPISLVNKTGGAITCNLYINTGGTRKRLTPQSLSIAAANQWKAAEIWPVASGDLVEGDASAVTSIEYLVGIVEL